MLDAPLVTTVLLSLFNIFDEDMVSIYVIHHQFNNHPLLTCLLIIFDVGRDDAIFDKSPTRV